MSKRLEMLESFCAKGSTDPFHWYARALELRSLGRLGDCLAGLQEVRRRFPDYVPTYLIAAQVAEELDRPEDAVDFAKAGVEVARAAGDAKALSELEAQLLLLE